MTDDRGPSTETAASHLYDILWPGGLAAQAVYAASKLELADLLASGPRTLEELAGSTGAHPPSLGRLLRALTSLGLFEEDGGRFRNTPVSEMLLQDRTDTAHPWAVFLGAPFVWRSWGGLLDSVMTGETAFDRVHGKTFYQHAADHPEDAEIYDVAMNAGATAIVDDVVAGYDFAHRDLIVDVGGGHGALLRGILWANPRPRGILFDLPGVVAGARTVPAGRLAERMDIVAGDALESVPGGGDLYLLKSVIHSFDDATAQRILGNCRTAMREGGRLLLVEIVLKEGQEPSARNAMMDLMMLTLAKGHERTRMQFAELLEASGFALERVIPTSRGSSIIEATRR